MKAGSSSCDTLMTSMAGKSHLVTEKDLFSQIVISCFSEGAHWGDDDWEACEVTERELEEMKGTSHQGCDR